METIIIKLDARKLKNPDLDIRYILPERIEEYTDHAVTDNGYDYLSDTELGIWLGAAHAQEAAAQIIALLKAETFCENDISESAELFISAEESADIEKCQKIYPE